ncbi:MAG TPA: PHP domain-containing protein [Candidatus Baltobacteraceae bacterium]|nr:PHP domain-containing protein [Candidatus Baltobacteraceae bacterium]
MLVDFHSHTTESDGTLSPAELVAAMRARGVSIFSITDHDTLAAYAAVADPAWGTLVPGVEINTTYRGNEVHVLGYGFAPDDAGLQAILTTNRRERNARARRMVQRLQSAGHALSFEDVQAGASDDAPLGRPHVARALVRAGLASDVDAAFRNFIGAGKPGYVPFIHISPQAAIEAIRRAGGVPVLAHPGRLIDESLIGEFAQAGIAGLEVFYPTHAPGQVAHFRELAKRYGLVMTGGSDFHDARWNARSVGMEIERADIEPFLKLVS